MVRALCMEFIYSAQSIAFLQHNASNLTYPALRFSAFIRIALEESVVDSEQGSALTMISILWLFACLATKAIAQECKSSATRRTASTDRVCRFAAVRWLLHVYNCHHLRWRIHLLEYDSADEFGWILEQWHRTRHGDTNVFTG